MARKLISKNFVPYQDEDRVEFIVDTDADFENLPEGCGTGSTAVSIESAKVMVVNTEGKWVVFGEPAPISIVGTWQLNSTLASGCPEVKINFTTNNNLTYNEYDEATGTDVEKETNSFVGMFNPYATALCFYVDDKGGNVSAGGMGSFGAGFDGIVHITDGDDIANEEFITWLKANATKVG